MEQKLPESPAETLARSAFGFVLLALLPAILPWIAFWLSPVSPEPTFAQLRTGIILGFGIVVVLLFGLCVWTFRTAPENLLPLSQKIVALLNKRWLTISLLLIVLEMNFFAAMALANVAPAIVEPARFLLACWSFLFLALVLTVNRYRLATWLENTRTVWTMTGLSLVIILALTGLYLLTNRFIQATGIADRIRGGLDYRELVFYDDGHAPTSQQFWAEQAQMQVEWLPYTYWTVEPFQGQFINVDVSGLRQTPNFAGEKAKKIFFFGGSTIWGEGARDAYTIPGHVARLLNEADNPQQIINFGQTGYVSTQDMLLFQMQLLRGNPPDIAVFYQGFNDILSACTQNITGLPLQEVQRIGDAEAGRILRRNRMPVLRPLEGDINQSNFSLVALSDNTAAAVVERWLAGVRMVQTLADAYSVQVIFVWQPALVFKQTLTGAEQHILTETDSACPGMLTLYQAADALVRQRVQDENIPNVIILSDLFKDDVRPIFYDLVHITEEGNLVVAQAIMPVLIAVLSEPD